VKGVQKEKMEVLMGDGKGNSGLGVLPFASLPGKVENISVEGDKWTSSEGD